MRLELGKRGKPAGMREDLLSGKTLVRIENNYPDVKARDVPWHCAMLLPPICTVIVSVTGAGLALKRIWSVWFLQALDCRKRDDNWPSAASRGLGIDTAPCGGSSCGLCFFQKDLGRKDAIERKLLHCLSTENKSLLSCQSFGGFISSITRKMSPFHCCQTLHRPGFSFIQTNRCWGWYLFN